MTSYLSIALKYYTFDQSELVLKLAALRTYSEGIIHTPDIQSKYVIEVKSRGHASPT